MKPFQLDDGDIMEENENEAEVADTPEAPKTRIDIEPTVKETAWKVTKGLLDFSTKAVFYLPGRKDHVAMKVLKGGALLHSAYSAWKRSTDGDEENRPVQESCGNEH